MTNDFKEGFSKGLGLTSGVLAIPVAGLLLFGAYKVLRSATYTFLTSEEMEEYYDCIEKSWDRFEERTAAYKKLYEEKLDVEIPPSIKCEKPTRKWKWQPKE